MARKACIHLAIRQLRLEIEAVPWGSWRTLRRRLVPLLLPHMADHMGLHVYYGSRATQPRRVRALLCLALVRLLDTPNLCAFGEGTEERRPLGTVPLEASRTTTVGLQEGIRLT